VADEHLPAVTRDPSAELTDQAALAGTGIAAEQYRTLRQLADADQLGQGP
jgi:hypothetical protein